MIHRPTQEELEFAIKTFLTLQDTPDVDVEAMAAAVDTAMSAMYWLQAFGEDGEYDSVSCDSVAD